MKIIWAFSFKANNYIKIDALKLSFFSKFIVTYSPVFNDIFVPAFADRFMQGVLAIEKPHFPSIFDGKIWTSNI